MDKRQFTIGTAWIAGAAWLEQLGNFVIFVIIARLIGTEEFGLASMALAFVVFGEVLVRETVTEGIIECKKLDESYLAAAFWALVGLGLVIVSVLLALAPTVAQLYGQPSITGLILATSPAVMLVALSGIPIALLRRRMAFKALAIRSTIGVLFGGVIGIVMALKGYGAWSLVFQRLAMMAIDGTLAIIAAGWVPKKRPSFRDLGLIGALGPQVVVLRAATMVIAQTPTVALGVASGPTAVAIYSLAWRLVEVIKTVTVAAPRSVAQSAIAASRRNGSSSAQAFLETNELVSLIGITAMAGFALVAHPSIAMIFGADWQQTEVILPWICLVGAIAALTDFQEAYLMAINRAKTYVQLVVAEALIGIGVIALASTFGVLVAAGALALRAAVFAPIRTRAVLRPERIATVDYARSIWPACLAAAGMAAVVTVWRILALGQMPDLLYLTGAVFLGVMAVIGILLVALPGVLSRFKSFVT